METSINNEKGEYKFNVESKGMEVELTEGRSVYVGVDDKNRNWVKLVTPIPENVLGLSREEQLFFHKSKCYFDGEKMVTEFWLTDQALQALVELGYQQLTGGMGRMEF